ARPAEEYLDLIARGRDGSDSHADATGLEAWIAVQRKDLTDVLKLTGREYRQRPAWHRLLRGLKHHPDPPGHLGRGGQLGGNRELRVRVQVAPHRDDADHAGSPSRISANNESTTGMRLPWFAAATARCR